jgi:hypothetical protein
LPGGVKFAFFEGFEAFPAIYKAPDASSETLVVVNGASFVDLQLRLLHLKLQMLHLKRQMRHRKLRLRQRKLGLFNLKFHLWHLKLRLP